MGMNGSAIAGAGRGATSPSSRITLGITAVQRSRSTIRSAAPSAVSATSPSRAGTRCPPSRSDWSARPNAPVANGSFSAATRARSDAGRAGALLSASSR